MPDGAVTAILTFHGLVFAHRLDEKIFALAGDRGAEDVAHGQALGQEGVAHDDVTRFAVLADDRDRAGPLGEHEPGQEGLVPAAVENGARVVAHAAVDRDIGAHPGDLLDRAHPVERDGRCRRDRAARLGGDRGRDARVPAGVLEHFCPRRDRGRLLALDVGNAESAAQAQLGQGQLVHERSHDLDGLGEGVEEKDLAPDVGVDADQVQVR